jgi:enolase-phosphatase E1
MSIRAILLDIEGTISPVSFARDVQGTMGRIYADVPPRLQEWRAQGIALYIYSARPVAAQKSLLGHSDQGDLRPLFSGYFDTQTGSKRDAASYHAIAADIGATGEKCLFLTDVPAELDAAHAAGWLCGQLVRDQDGTVGDVNYINYTDFTEIHLHTETK